MTQEALGMVETRGLTAAHLKQYLRVRQSVKTMLMKRLITFSMEGIKKQTALFLVKHLKVSPGR
mgnify:CR=1 FL=1